MEDPQPGPGPLAFTWKPAQEPIQLLDRAVCTSRQPVAQAASTAQHQPVHAAMASHVPPLERHISDPASTSHFGEYVHKKKDSVRGRDGCNSERGFIPYGDLYEYWKRPGRILDVCKSYPRPIVVRPDAILQGYLRVFSTLVYTTLLPFLPAFLENGLTDEHFPVDILPAVWANLPSHQVMFERFREYQWTFFPLIIDSNKLLDRRVPLDCILPISTSQVVRDNDATLISKVVFHPSCVNIRNSDAGHNASNTYIIKTYKGDRHQQQYLHEYRAFDALQGNENNHVIACYGAFRHGDTYNLVLQYVQGCNLLEFLKTQPPPSCARDVLTFWSSLAKTLIGLHHLHRVSIQNGDPARYELVHQDIKLDNILLELHGHGYGDRQQDDHAYSFSPFIADLGNSHVGHIDSHDVALPAVDRRGNPLYCAPEATRDAGSTWKGTSYLTWEADIFSMGAVLSDVATWVVFGQDGRQQYHQQRVEETNTVSGFRDSGYEGTFHDGAEPLNCVRATHDRIFNKLQPWDRITSRILSIIDGHMLTRNNRPRAKWLYYKLQNEIDKVRKEQLAWEPEPAPVLIANELEPVPSVPSTPTPSTPRLIYSPGCDGSNLDFCASPHPIQGSEASSPMTPPAGSVPFPTITQKLHGLAIDGSNPVQSEKLATRPVSTSVLCPPAELSRGLLNTDDGTRRSRSTSDLRLSMADTQDYRSQRKAGHPVRSSVEEAIATLQSDLGLRDYIFLIEDTATMREHSDQIVTTFHDMAYVAKRLDPNGLELIFASEPGIAYKRRHTTPLVEILKNHKYPAVPLLSLQGALETSLAIVINRRIIPRLPKRIPLWGHTMDFNYKPITMFVFTDGKWGAGVKRGNGLDSTIRNLMEEIRKRGLTRTRVMIQFLRFGDDEEGWAHLKYLDEFGKKEDCDIVDTRNITDDVFSMFVASYTQANDDSERTSPALPSAPAQGHLNGLSTYAPPPQLH